MLSLITSCSHPFDFEGRYYDDFPNQKNLVFVLVKESHSYNIPNCYDHSEIVTLDLNSIPKEDAEIMKNRHLNHTELKPERHIYRGYDFWGDDSYDSGYEMYTDNNVRDYSGLDTAQYIYFIDVQIKHTFLFWGDLIITSAKLCFVKNPYYHTPEGIIHNDPPVMESILNSDYHDDDY